jgi:NAD(P)-dependent dehydrogenase (short-subunit alcohol dehydrogenase family)
MPTKPEGKVALVTGALTGIGRAAAIIFAQEGAHIVVSCLGVEINKDKS